MVPASADEFVRQERIRLELGPEHLALAVAEDDVDQLTIAMRAASSMWGGRRFPLLVVGKGRARGVPVPTLLQDLLCLA